MVVELVRNDSSILRARLEKRNEGTYAIDLRAWGRGRPTLKPTGSLVGTKDLREAKELARRELAAVAGGLAGGTPIAARTPMEQVEAYIRRKRSQKKMTQHTAASAYTCIARCWAILNELFGVARWAEVDREHIGPLVDALTERTFDGRRLKQNTILKHCNYTKGFFRHAVDERIVKASPMHDHTAIPQRDKSFVRPWLEPWEMGLLLETSFKLRAGYPHNACQEWPEILATEMYTGAREDEVLGLAVAQVSFTGGDRGAGTIDFKDNRWRKLKNPQSARTFSMWPAHAKILRAYMQRARPPRDGLLFPNGRGKMWADLRESMARDLKAAGITKAITDHSMRHSYISARSRMYVRHVEGKRIVERAVHHKDISLEVGHGSERMVREIYDHDSQHPVEGWVDLDYATALGVFRKGLRKPPSGRAAPKRATRSASKRSGARTGRRTGPT